MPKINGINIRYRLLFVVTIVVILLIPTSVADVNDLRRHIKPLTEVAAKRDRKCLKYNHHYIIVANESNWETHLRIVEYGSVDGCKDFVCGNSGGVVKMKNLSIQALKEDIRNGLHVIEKTGYPETPKDFDEATNRYKTRLGEKDYFACINNCEHFASWVMTGKSYSQQIKDAGIKEIVAGNATDVFVNNSKSEATIVAASEYGMVLGSVLANVEGRKRHAYATKDKKIETDETPKQDKETDTGDVEEITASGNQYEGQSVKDVNLQKVDKGDSEAANGNELKETNETLLENTNTYIKDTATFLQSSMDNFKTMSNQMDIAKLLVQHKPTEPENAISKLEITTDHAKSIAELILETLEKFRKQFAKEVSEILKIVAKTLLSVSTFVLGKVKTLGLNLLKTAGEMLSDAIIKPIKEVASLVKSVAFKVSTGIICLAANSYFAYKKLQQLDQLENRGIISKHDSNKEKFKSVLGAVYGAGGAVIGQGLCPIPFVGAAVGNFLGQLTISVAFDIVDKLDS